MAERTRSRSYGPTVLAGLAAAALTAVAASRTWAHASGRSAGIHVTASSTGSSSAPLAVALALVSLAAWGVVLVLRGRARRVVAVVGALASAGVVAATVVSAGRAQHDAVRAVLAKGGTGDAFSTSLTAWYFVCAVAAVLAKGGTGDAFSTSLTAWYFVCAVAAVLTLVTFVVAVVAAPRWPAMGSRYDAPAARAAEPQTEQDLWRALDQGHDPTA